MNIFKQPYTSYSYTIQSTQQKTQKFEVKAEETPEEMLRDFMINSIKKIDGVIKMLDRKFPYLKK